LSTPSRSNAETPAQPPHGKRQADRIARRKRLLDAAERLFAEFGYEGTALRDITAAAGTRLASVTDEFGGKEHLFREVLIRRALPLEADRLQLLKAIPEEVRGPERIAAVVDAFVEPMLSRAQDHEGWRYYFRFIAQLANSRPAAQFLVAEEYNRVALLFVEAFKATYPESRDEAAYDAYMFMLGTALEVFADSLRLDSLSGGKFESGDFSRRCAALRVFTTAGVVSILTDPPAREKRPTAHDRAGARSPHADTCPRRTADPAPLPTATGST
jgi:AcrR family transcriptional regulator